MTNRNNVATDLIYKCALIDACGNEIPITDAMIVEACKAFEQQYDNHFAAPVAKPKAASRDANVADSAATV